MRALLFRYACAVQYRDYLLWGLVSVLLVTFTLLNGLITHAIALGYEGEAVERVSYSYLYSFSGRVGYVQPLILSAYMTTASLTSRQAVRLCLLGGGKDNAFRVLWVSSVLFGGGVGSLGVVINHAVSAFFLYSTGYPTKVFADTQLEPSLRMIALQWIWALLGAGLGFIIRNLAILTGIILTYALFIEPTLSAVSNQSQSLMSFTKWLPGPLNWASSWDTGAGSASIRAAIGLPGNYAVAVMLIYAVLIFVFGYTQFRNRALR